MRILFIDTETQHLPDTGARARDPKQPHIVQFASIYRDGTGAEDCYNEIVKPDGWTIPDETAAIHGITTEMAMERGIPEIEVVDYFIDRMRHADLVVGHNISFDKFIMRIGCRRFDRITDEHDQWWKQFPTFCTMTATTNLCKLPGKYPGRYKWPKLAEAYKHAFGDELQGAHDALADVRGCVRLYDWLKKMVVQPVAA